MPRQITPRLLMLALVISALGASGCETTPKAKPASSSATASTNQPAQQPVKKHIPHALEVREILRKDPTMKEFDAYRKQWRDWPKDTGKFKTTTKYRFPGGEFLIWWKPDKHTPESTMAAYRLTKYRE